MIPDDPTRFVVLCHERTGSTLLGTLLASHPQIRWAGEYFKEIKKRARRSLRHRLTVSVVYRRPTLYLGWQARRFGCPNYGCKLMPHYVADIDRSVHALHQHDWRIIWLRRRDVLTGAISRIVAAAGQHWVTASGQAPPVAQTQRIEPADLLAEMRQRVRMDEAEQRSVADLPHLHLFYEDDLADAANWPATMERVFAYLGLLPIVPQRSVNKTWDRPYQEFVANYAELIEAVRNSELRHLAPVYDEAGRQISGNAGRE